MRILFTLILIGWASCCFAGKQVTSRDFAYGYLLKTKGKAAVYALPIPKEVYRQVRRADLGDIRVFNGAGEIVPHSFRIPAWDRRERGAVRDLPIFPLMTDDKSGTENISLSVRKDDSGTIIALDSKTGDRDRGNRSGYLLDLGEHPEQVAELELYWQVLEDTGSVSINIQQSYDLQNWTTLVNRATLVDLEYGGNRVEHRTVKLPRQPVRYLKIGMDDHAQHLQIDRVAGVSTRHVSRQRLQWVSLYNGVKIKADSDDAIKYTSNYRLPVNAVQVRFPEQNSIIRGSVQSRKDQKDNWVERCRAVFYSLQLEGEMIQNEPCTFRPASDRDWRIVIDDDGAGLEGKNRSLTLELGWQSGELLFVARGSGPFLLAYGSGRLEAEEEARSSDMVLAAIRSQQESNLVKEAKPGKRLELGGAAALEPPPAARPWKTWLLWAVLAGGVILMAFMAASLLREMRDKEKPASGEDDRS